MYDFMISYGKYLESIGFKFESFNQSTKLFCSEISKESDILFSTIAEVISFLLKKSSLSWSPEPHHKIFVFAGCVSSWQVFFNVGKKP